MRNSEQQEWEAYKARELAGLTPLLAELGYTLEAAQPHTGGERHLTRPIGSGRKLLLLGRSAEGARVVIKATSDPLGKAEIAHERTCRSVLERVPFAYQAFLSPAEILFVQRGGYDILVSEFIEQERSFLERPVEEQFALALRAFKAQESAHATTAAHLRLIAGTFGEMHAPEYRRKLAQYAHEVAALAPDASRTHKMLERAQALLAEHAETLERYTDFLTHWDFTPQNIRVRGSDIYLLDHSSMHFGNKYESWARFINFMELYNPPLAHALVRYVADNRTPEESLSLRLMRVYRLGELIRYYAGWLPRTQGNLKLLAQARIDFWTTVLEAVLDNKEVPLDVVEEYTKTRDALRSEDEKQRQVGLH